MATRAEQFRSQQERANGTRGKKKRKAQRKPKKAAWSHEKHHADVKATHALEDTAPGTRPSRESTRSSSNRSKPDSAFNLTEEVRKGAPRMRATSARAKQTKVRGGGGP
jgi:hypothetical protein